jgi:hypothetical protein
MGLAEVIDLHVRINPILALVVHTHTETRVADQRIQSIQLLG